MALLTSITQVYDYLYIDKWDNKLWTEIKVDKGQEKVLKLHKVHFINESNTFIVRFDKNSENWN